jgi:hypothetical protein
MNHPYEKYEPTEIWVIIRKSLRELEKNNDIVITTHKNYVIGFLCKALSTSSSQPSLAKPTRSKREPKL